MKLLIILITVMVLLPNSALADSYLYEFSKFDENAILLSSWTFITRADSLERNVDIYEYCGIEGCMKVLFDTKNITELNKEQSKSLLENCKLKEYVDNGLISENLYSFDFGKESLVCEFVTPSFGEEAKDATVEIASDKIAPKILPYNAAKLVRFLYSNGKKIKIVKDVNYPTLLLGASCITGNYLESKAATSLKSCQGFVGNIKRNSAYEGQGLDLINCHSNSINDLNIASISPDLQLKSFQEKSFEIIKNSLCELGILGSNCIIQSSQTTLDSLGNKISSLKQSYPVIDPIDINDSAEKSVLRIRYKDDEVTIKLNEIEEMIKENEKMINEKKFNIVSNIIDFFFIEYRDFTEAENHNNMTKQKVVDAKNLQQTYKFNTALAILEEAFNQINLSSSAVNAEEIKIRQVNWLPVILVAIVIIVILLLSRYFF